MNNNEDHELNFFDLDVWEDAEINDIIFGQFGDILDPDGNLEEITEIIEDDDAGNPREFDPQYLEYSVNQHNDLLAPFHDISFTNYGNNSPLDIWLHIFNPDMFADIADASDTRRAAEIERKRAEFRAAQRSSSNDYIRPFRLPDELKNKINSKDIMSFFAFNLYTMIDQKARVSMYFDKDFKTQLVSPILPSLRAYRRIRRVFCFPRDNTYTAEYMHVEYLLKEMNS